MLIHRINLKSEGENENLSLAIGFFDGIHKGHMSLIREVLKQDEEGSLVPAVLTFESDFKAKLFHTDPELILTEEEKEHRFFTFGIQEYYLLPSKEEIYSSSVHDFLKLLRHLHCRKIVVGEDFTFAKRGKGKASDLLSLQKYGIEVKIIPLLEVDHEKVSSTLIRNCLKEGRIENANGILGYPFFLKGKVIHGLENGRKIGFPTANQEYPLEKLRLPDGVYKTNTIIKGKLYPSMTNIGNHPTIDSLTKPIIETNVIGYEGDLYGVDIEVRFLSYIRPQVRFSSLDELKSQLIQDREKCRS